MKGIRKAKQAWIFCRTKRGKKNYRQRVAYRAEKGATKMEKLLTALEAQVYGKDERV